jgi:hypothetical protein
MVIQFWCFSVNYLPLLEGICVQRGDTGRWVLAMSRQRDSETSRRTPRVYKGSDQPNHPLAFAYPPVIACRRLVLKVAERVSSVAELTSTSILDNSMRA